MPAQGARWLIVAGRVAFLDVDELISLLGIDAAMFEGAGAPMRFFQDRAPA